MELIDIAKNALVEYGIEDAAITLLRHNENAVWKVELPDGRCYVLRIHTPASGLVVEHRADWLESEMLFLNELATKSDINVQHPVRTKDGRYYLPANDGYATLLSWLPGETLKQSDSSAEHLAFLVGELTAKMHDFVLTWPGSNKLLRPKYDSDRIMNAADSIKEGIEKGLFTRDMYHELYEGAKCISRRMEYENSRQGWHGLIHSDLGLGNLIVYNGNVSPIDFGLCGHGPFLFDLGGLMGTFDHASLRKAVIDGYAKHRIITQDDCYSIEAFFLASIYLFMSMHLHNTYVYEWFERRLPLVIQDYVRPLISDSRFLDKLLE